MDHIFDILGVIFYCFLMFCFYDCWSFQKSVFGLDFKAKYKTFIFTYGFLDSRLERGDPKRGGEGFAGREELAAAPTSPASLSFSLGSQLSDEQQGLVSFYSYIYIYISTKIQNTEERRARILYIFINIYTPGGQGKYEKSTPGAQGKYEKSKPGGQGKYSKSTPGGQGKYEKINTR